MTRKDRTEGIYNRREVLDESAGQQHAAVGPATKTRTAGARIPPQSAPRLLL